MTEKKPRAGKFFQQLPTRLLLRRYDALGALDEAIAALRQLAPASTPPAYMIQDLQKAGALLSFRPNSRAYLQHIGAKASRAEGDVLECGSGLSSLLLGVMARDSGIAIHTFEHDARVHRELSALVQRYRLHNLTLHHTPIRAYGGFDWYQFDSDSLSRRFRLVVCDGPARHLTDSGRYGLFPLMRDRLDPACKVIMDDSHRLLERNVIQRWSREHSIEVKWFGRFLRYAEITCL